MEDWLLHQTSHPLKIKNLLYLLTISLRCLNKDEIIRVFFTKFGMKAILTKGHKHISSSKCFVSRVFCYSSILRYNGEMLSINSEYVSKNQIMFNGERYPNILFQLQYGSPTR